MNTNPRTSRRLAAGSLAAAAVAVLAAANPAVGTSHSAYDAACSFDPAYLPRTADAAQGWYDQCRAQQPFVTTKAGLPSTEGAQDWYVQRKTGLRLAGNPGPSSSEQTETPTADRPANWRRLMDEVPESPTADRPANWRRLVDEVPESPTADRPANWRRLVDEVPEAPQQLGRPAPSTGGEENGFRGTVESGAGHPAWTGDRSPMDTESAQERVRDAFERGVGPGQSFYS